MGRFTLKSFGVKFHPNNDIAIPKISTT